MWTKSNYKKKKSISYHLAPPCVLEQNCINGRAYWSLEFENKVTGMQEMFILSGKCQEVMCLLRESAATAPVHRQSEEIKHNSAAKSAPTETLTGSFRVTLKGFKIHSLDKLYCFAAS